VSTHRPLRVAEVLDARSGRCVDTVRWREGGWVADDDRAFGEGSREGNAPPYEEWED